MSFTRQIKNELARLPLQQFCCVGAELTALVQFRGSLTLGENGSSLEISAPNAAVARRTFLLLKNFYGTSPRILVHQHKRLRKEKRFLLKIPIDKNARVFCDSLDFLKDCFVFGRHIPAVIIRNRCCRRSYLRGAFLSGGTVSKPGSSGYHLEILTTYEKHSIALMQLMETFQIKANCFSRKGKFVVYIKSGENISEFLRVIGAHAALLRFESIRVLKGMRNQVNRLVNCETANLTKTVAAAQDQVEAIRIVQGLTGLDNLPVSLRQVAKLRLEHPEATLSELGQLSFPPLSKSCVNHRLRRLKNMARLLHEKSPGKRS